MVWPWMYILGHCYSFFNKILVMNDRLLKYKEALLTWDNNHRNYSLSIDWVELNNIANDLGNPFNIGCRSCLNDLASYIIAIIKERNI